LKFQGNPSAIQMLQTSFVDAGFLQSFKTFFSKKSLLVIGQDSGFWAPLPLCHQKRKNDCITLTKTFNMAHTQEFMLLFSFEPNFTYQPTAADLEAMQQQWGAFIGGLAIQERLVSTHQLGFEGKRITADNTVHEGINIANNMTLGGNMIVKANGLDHAVEMAKGCPILGMGGTVEVRNITPM
jgi:hypothetical protein